MTDSQKAKDRVSTASKKAVGLKYDGTNTPKIIAKGEGVVAEEIVSLAQQHDVHIHYDPLLLEVLAHLELDDEIPEVLYLSVAKIIAFAYFLQGKHPNKKNSQPSKVEELPEHLLKLKSKYDNTALINEPSDKL